MVNFIQNSINIEKHQRCTKGGDRGSRCPLPPRFWQIRRRQRAAAARRITTNPPGFLTLGASLTSKLSKKSQIFSILFKLLEVWFNFRPFEFSEFHFYLPPKIIICIIILFKNCGCEICSRLFSNKYFFKV